jgi:hypothetical protein
VVLTEQCKVVVLRVVRVINSKAKKAVHRILHGVVSAILANISVVATSAGLNIYGLLELKTKLKWLFKLGLYVDDPFFRWPFFLRICRFVAL